MEQTENQRLKIVMSKLGFKTQSAFARALNVKQGSLSDIFREKPGVGVSNSIKDKLEILYKVNKAWIETGEGPMLLEENSHPHVAQDHQDHYGGQNPDIKDKLILSYERNLEAQEKNIRLLEEISKLKDKIIEKEQQFFRLMEEEKKSEHPGTRVSP